MALFPNDLRIYISSSPLECKIDSLSIFISSVICLCTTMFGHFSVHQHPGVSRFASLTSLCSSFLAAFALYTAAPAFRRFSKYFHFFVFFFGVAVSSEGAIFFPFLYRPKSRFFLSFFIFGSHWKFPRLPPPCWCCFCWSPSASPPLLSLSTQFPLTTN